MNHRIENIQNMQSAILELLGDLDWTYPDYLQKTHYEINMNPCLIDVMITHTILNYLLTYRVDEALHTLEQYDMNNEYSYYPFVKNIIDAIV